MTESMAWRLALVGTLMAAALALIIGGGSIGAGVNAVSLSLWHFIQTAQAPGRIDLEGTAIAPAAGGTAERDLTVTGPAAGGHEEVRHNLASMSQAFTLVSSASDPWMPLAAPPASTSPSSTAVPVSPPVAAGPFPGSVPTVSVPADGPAFGPAPQQPPAVAAGGQAGVPADGAASRPAPQQSPAVGGAGQAGVPVDGAAASRPAPQQPPAVGGAGQKGVPADGAASRPAAQQPPAVGGAGQAGAPATKKDLDGALAALGEAVHRDSRTAEAFKQRALDYAARKDTDKAIESWTGAIELATAKPGRLSDLDLFIAYGSRAALYDGKHQFTREIADLTQMLDNYRLKPELAEALDEAWGAASTRELLSSIYKQRAKASELLALYDKAMADLGAAIELDRDRAAEAYGERARIEQKLGHSDRALGDLRAALRLDPGMREAREALARLEAEAAPRPSGRVRASPNEADHRSGVHTSARPVTSATAGSPATP